jgi:hypothetical protein
MIGMDMRRLIICLSASLLFLACSGTRNDEGARLDPDMEKLIDVLTLFVESVQGDRFEKAMGYLTVEEKSKMTDASGQVPPPVQKQLKALRLSTLANKAGVRLEKGRLTGIHPWLPNIDRSTTGSANGPMIDASPLIQ